MAIAPMAAAIIASATFHSPSNVFNERTPCTWMHWSVRRLDSTDAFVHAHAERFGQAQSLPQMRILTKSYHRRALRLPGLHRITQHADPRDRHLHGVPGHQWTNT